MWEVSLILGLIGTSAIFIYAGSQLQSRGLISSSLKTLLIIFALILVVFVAPMSTQIINTNNGTGTNTSKYVHMLELTDAHQFVSMWMVIVILFMFVLIYIFDVFDKGRRNTPNG